MHVIICVCVGVGVCVCVCVCVCVILMKTGQNGNIEGKHSKYNFFNVIIWKWKPDISCVHRYKK